MDCALKNRDLLKDTSVVEVGRHLINYLMNLGDYDTAVKYLPQVKNLFILKNIIIILLKICCQQKDEWEFYVGKFEKTYEILKLALVIPINDPQLEPECYESILTVALYTSTNIFSALIFQWNTDLYRVGKLN